VLWEQLQLINARPERATARATAEPA